MKQTDLRATTDITVIDDYLISKGLPKEEIDSIRQTYNIYFQISMAAEIFQKNNWNNFSTLDLTALVSPKEIIIPGRNSVTVALKELYGNENENSLINVNNMALFRKFTENYYGNLFEARKIWPNFQPGKKDWKENINIPLSIDKKVSQLLGLIWIDGTAYTENGVRILLEGKQDDRQLYNEYLIDFLKSVFNYKTTVQNSDFVKAGIYSKAINTWLIKDLKYDILSHGRGVDKNKKRILPKNMRFLDSDIRRGFLEGIIAGKLYLSLTERRAYFIDKKRVMTDAIEYLLKKEEIAYSICGKGIYFNSTSTKRILFDYVLLNPKHVKAKEHLSAECDGR